MDWDDYPDFGQPARSVVDTRREPAPASHARGHFHDDYDDAQPTLARTRRRTIKKCASETFAFAAGALEDGTDLMSLLEDSAFSRPASNAHRSSAVNADPAHLDMFDVPHQRAGGQVQGRSFAAPDFSNHCASDDEYNNALDRKGASTPDLGDMERSNLRSRHRLPRTSSAPGTAKRSSTPGQSSLRTNVLDMTKLDPKRARRILANRQSAQRSRMKRLQFIHELEKQMNSLVLQINDCKIEKDHCFNRRQELLSTMFRLRQRLATAIQEVVYQEALQVAVRSEISRLRALREAETRSSNHSGVSPTNTEVNSDTLTPASSGVARAMSVQEPVPRPRHRAMSSSGALMQMQAKPVRHGRDYLLTHDGYMTTHDYRDETNSPDVHVDRDQYYGADIAVPGSNADHRMHHARGLRDD